jgi:regulator of replication initiation timing
MQMAGKVKRAGADKAVIELYFLEKQLVELVDEIDKAKAKIARFFDENDDVKLMTVSGPELLDKNLVIHAKKTERVIVKYDTEKLRKALGPDMLAEVIVKSHKLVDYPEFVKVCKKAGLKPKQAKAMIETTEKIDVDAMKKLYSMGELTLERLKGCYEATISKSIKLTEGVKD